MKAVPQRSALDFFPGKITFHSLKDAAADCKGCELYKVGTQTVFGEGKVPSELMFVGEVPGDYEDLEGRPFVGPAGKLFDKALEEANIDRKQTYVTNVVKHFKWKPSPRGGKRRLHEKPNAAEIRACSPWLGAELKLVHPRILVCLGATAAQSLLGKDFRVTKMRGQWIESEHAERTIATIHPSAILRAPDPDMRETQYREFVSDLLTIAREL
ncbi:MAG TPA: UdgX family uracil-DNA binding protein [Pyrinomonadaceae bacterium]|nr:UdgX family uracil-DNA binding protein [Pyrinomonadaceae bacterium]